MPFINTKNVAGDFAPGVLGEPKGPAAAGVLDISSTGAGAGVEGLNTSGGTGVQGTSDSGSGVALT